MKNDEKILNTSDDEQTPIKEEFRYNEIKDWIDEKELTQDSFWFSICNNYSPNLENFNEKTFNNYLNGKVKSPNIEVLKRIACEMDVSLDYLCYLTEDKENKKEPATKMAYMDELLHELGLTKDLKNALANYNQLNYMDYKYNLNKKKEDIENEQKNYNKILKQLLNTPINTDKGKMTFVELFNKYILQILICTIVKDKNFMETYSDKYYTLAYNINQYQTKKINNKKTNYTFEQILQFENIKELYQQAQNELHNGIDKLLETALKEAFGENTHEQTLLDKFKN